MKDVRWQWKHPAVYRSHTLRPNNSQPRHRCLGGKDFTSSLRIPLPVVPKVSIAKTSPSSILVLLEFLMNGTCLSPWI